MAYKVKLNSFEGPLDLLVYLIESSKMNIYDININDITKQYIEYINLTRDMNIEIASEFMVLSATLLNIKSKMLIPREREANNSGSIEDPRNQLIDMILEYKRFKKIATLFREMEESGSYIIEKPMEDMEELLNNPIELLSLKEDEFMSAFEKFLIKKKKTFEIKRNYEKVQRNKETSEERTLYIKDFLKSSDIECNFFDVVKDKKDKYDRALTFSSVLELVKQRDINARQEKNFGDIFIWKGENLS